MMFSLCKAEISLTRKKIKISLISALQKGNAVT